MAFRSILQLPNKFIQLSSFKRTISIFPSLSSNFRASELFKGIEQHPEVEVIWNPPEWKYVEYLLGKKTVPIPKVKQEYPSGWTPPDPAKYKNFPYFIERTRNYMLPVYLNTKFRGLRRITKITGIEGDIWKLEADLHQLIEKRAKKKIYSRINEMNRQIVFRGDFVTLVKKHLIAQGF